jgi:prefoldin subunit 5
MDQETIKNAETRVAELQSALDETQQILKDAEQTQQTVEKSAQTMRMVAVAAVGGLVIVTVLHMLRRRHH